MIHLKGAIRRGYNLKVGKSERLLKKVKKTESIFVLVHEAGITSPIPTPPFSPYFPTPPTTFLIIQHGRFTQISFFPPPIKLFSQEMATTPFIKSVSPPAHVRGHAEQVDGASPVHVYYRAPIITGTLSPRP